MKKLFFILSTSLLVSCSTHKVISNRDYHSSFENPQTKTMSKSRSLESQHELAVLMRSWTQEQRDEFRKKYVYSEVNIFLKNGDSLTIK
jgi:hypothetical protein